MDIEPPKVPKLDALQSSIQQSWDEAKGGELFSQDEVKIQMADFKKSWHESRLVETK